MDKINSSDDSFEWLNNSSTDSDSFSFLNGSDGIKQYEDRNANDPSDYSVLCEEFSNLKDYNLNDFRYSSQLKVFKTSNDDEEDYMKIDAATKNMGSSTPKRGKSLEQQKMRKRRSIEQACAKNVLLQPISILSKDSSKLYNSEYLMKAKENELREREIRLAMRERTFLEKQEQLDERECREKQRIAREQHDKYQDTCSGYILKGESGCFTSTDPFKQYYERMRVAKKTDLEIYRDRLAQFHIASLSKDCPNNDNGGCKHFFEANSLEDENRQLKDRLQFCSERNKLLESFYRTVNYKVEKYEQYGRKEVKLEDCDKSGPPTMPNIQINYIPIEAEHFLNRVKDNAKRLDKLIQNEE